MKRKILTLLLFISFFFLSSDVYARSGCCSWHGGVSGCDSNVGRQVCNDGTYSPTCTCWIEQTPTSAPTLDLAFPKINAQWAWYPNKTNQTFNLKVNLSDPDPSRYSAVLSKCIGCDPGPSVDFNKPEFWYYDVSAGKWYLNVKKEISGYWSTVVYWVITVPEWYPPPTPTPFPTPTNSIINSLSIPDIPITSFLFFGIAGYLFYLLVKKVKK